MDSKAAVTLVANGRRVCVYFITNLAITLVRQTIATALECVLRPVSGPDASFVDPVTGRNFQIRWETRIHVNYGAHPATVVAYVVDDEEIGFPLLVGMDAILALQGALTIDGNEQMNTLFPIPGENNMAAPRPVLATGLTVSMASEFWYRHSEKIYTERASTGNHQDPVTNTTFAVSRIMELPQIADPDFCVLITNIITEFMLGINFLRTVNFRIQFPDVFISWPQTQVVRPYRHPARAIAGPSCPRCGLNGHVPSRCTERRD